MALRLAVFGQAPLANECLDRLLADGHEIATVYAPEDGSRPDALAAHARELGLRVVQRRYFQKKSGDPIAAALEDYQTLNVDLNVLASFTSFLPAAITDAPKHKSVCFHPSILPRYRGGNAMQWQIIDGEPEVGVTIFVPDTGVDTGPVVVQKGGVTIDATDTTGSLFFNKLAPLGVDAIVEAVNLIDTGEASLDVQDESRATHQGLVKDADAAVDLSRAAEEVDRLIRGCDPQPGAWVRFNGDPVRLYDAERVDGGGTPGDILSSDDNGMVLAVGDGAIRIGRVRADSGKEPAQAFIERSGATRFDSA